MKILFVEDNAGFAGDLQRALSEVPGVSSVVIAADKEAAIQALSSDVADLVILDLAIPPSGATATPDPEHGQAVFHEARTLKPGTPIFILTGSEVDKFSRSLARFGNQVQLWGDRSSVETVSYFRKEEVDELLERVTALARSFENMTAVAINTRGRDLGLTAVDTQMLKSYSKSVDCIACDVSSLSGGLSDAKVVKATAVDTHGKAQALCAGKLGPRETIEQEIEAYDRHARKLGIGACPPLFGVIDQGVGQNGAIFYTLSDDDTLSLFERLAADPSIGPTAVASVRSALARWIDARTAATVSIADIRRRMISSDDQAQALLTQVGLEPLFELEQVCVQASRGCIHGDLHCGNVLVKSSGGVVVIDFGDAGEGFSALDPVALELSMVFHPDAEKHGLRGQLIDRLASWPNVEEFAGDSKLKPTITACRDWAHDVGGGDLSVLASGLAYGLRQLKYGSVPADITAGFLKKVAERIKAT